MTLSKYYGIKLWNGNVSIVIGEQATLGDKVLVEWYCPMIAHVLAGFDSSRSSMLSLWPLVSFKFYCVTLEQLSTKTSLSLTPNAHFAWLASGHCDNECAIVTPMSWIYLSTSCQIEIHYIDDQLTTVQVIVWCHKAGPILAKFQNPNSASMCVKIRYSLFLYKAHFLGYKLPIVDTRCSKDRLIYIVGIRPLVRWHLYIETASGYYDVIW